jgi:predicted protein tyrosine phosphatase
LFQNHPRYEARSAGTENGARVKVTDGHLGWADRIFCRESKHVDQLCAQFPEELADKQPITLQIPDDYQFMDPELVALLQTELATHLDL